MKRYNYNMGHHWVTETQIGQIKPMLLQEVTPGDIWNGRINGIIRTAPLDVPAYCQIKAHVKVFFVPHSLVWDEFEDEITGVDTPTWPTLTLTSFSTQPLLKELPLDITVGTDTINALPVRAYNQLCHDWFRVDDATLTPDAVAVQQCMYPQNSYYGAIRNELQQSTTETVDSSGATIDVTDIRDAFTRQRLKEHRSQFGQRYKDLLRSLGVRPSDDSIDRSVYCGGGSATLGISEVVATATSTSENTGDYRGHGVTAIHMNLKPRQFKEHGTLIGVYYLRPRLAMQSCIDRIFQITDKEDLYFPELNNQTQETVRNDEVTAENSAAPKSNFGYVPKYHHLRYPRDVVTGDMRSDTNWHTHQQFTSDPTSEYMQTVQTTDQIWQDQTAGRVDFRCLFVNNVRKRSIIRPGAK